MWVCKQFKLGGCYSLSKSDFGCSTETFLYSIKSHQWSLPMFSNCLISQPRSQWTFFHVSLQSLVNSRIVNWKFQWSPVCCTFLMSFILIIERWVIFTMNFSVVMVLTLSIGDVWFISYDRLCVPKRERVYP